MSATAVGAVGLRSSHEHHCLGSNLQSTDSQPGQPSQRCHSLSRLLGNPHNRATAYSAYWATLQSCHSLSRLLGSPRNHATAYPAYWRALEIVPQPIPPITLVTMPRCVVIRR